MNQLAKQLLPVIEKLDVNGVGEPVASPRGYQIVQLCGKKSNDEFKYEDVKDFLTAECKIVPVETKELTKMDLELRESAKIKRNLNSK